ncbi:hypothetical protein GCM10017776_15660 [Streptomyces griseoluteus]|nr:hypothetical protein GCM10017776_15660 [Streptomyces griseoluteus]
MQGAVYLAHGARVHREDVPPTLFEPGALARLHCHTRTVAPFEPIIDCATSADASRRTGYPALRPQRPSSRPAPLSVGYRTTRPESRTRHRRLRHSGTTGHEQPRSRGREVYA